MDVSGYPAVMFEPSSDTSSEYFTTCENERIYSFKIGMIVPITNNVDRDKARDMLLPCQEKVINVFDQDFTL